MTKWKPTFLILNLFLEFEVLRAYVNSCAAGVPRILWHCCQIHLPHSAQPTWCENLLTCLGYCSWDSASLYSEEVKYILVFVFPGGEGLPPLLSPEIIRWFLVYISRYGGQSTGLEGLLEGILYFWF